LFSFLWSVGLLGVFLSKHQQSVGVFVKTPVERRHLI